MEILCFVVSLYQKIIWIWIQQETGTRKIARQVYREKWLWVIHVLSTVALKERWNITSHIAQYRGNSITSHRKWKRRYVVAHWFATIAFARRWSITIKTRLNAARQVARNELRTIYSKVETGVSFLPHAACAYTVVQSDTPIAWLKDCRVQSWPYICIQHLHKPSCNVIPQPVLHGITLAFIFRILDDKLMEMKPASTLTAIARDSCCLLVILQA